MALFRLPKETAPTSTSGRAGAVAIWALFGAVVGFMAYYPLAILLTSSTKRMIAVFEDWTWPAFVALTAVASAAIPFTAILRLSGGRVEDWSRLLRAFLIVAAVAFPLSTLIALVIFGIVRSSWQYQHDGVADCFLLAIPVATAVAVVVSGLVRRKDHAA